MTWQDRCWLLVEGVNDVPGCGKVEITADLAFPPSLYHGLLHHLVYRFACGRTNKIQNYFKETTLIHIMRP